MPPDALTADQQRALAQMIAVYPVADELGARFADAGDELYLVGGTVRDTFLGARRSDLDFATSARPETTEKLLRGWADHIWLTGARFGTVSARKDDAVLEITTFRADSYTPGSRHPEVVYGDDLAGDLARRDLTVNAMALSLPDHTFVDPFGGLSDLHNRVLRTPIDPQTSFGDDPLRMVRLARFAAVLDAEVDAAARDAATEMAAALDTVSAERIRDELSKLICAPAFGRGVDLLVETRLAHRFIPEVPRMAECRDDLHRHKDVYTHTLAVVDGCNPDDLVLRLAALLHDIGKPDTRRFEGGGKVTFHHHEVVGARMARKRLTALRYPKDVVESVAHLVALHLRFHGYADGEWTDAAVRRYVRDAGSDEQLSRLNELTRADVTTRNKNRMRRFHRAMDDLEERIARLRQEEELAALRPDLDGNAIMAHLGIEPGPKVGQAYQMLLEARIERGSLGEEGARMLLDEWAREQGLIDDDTDDEA